MLVLRALFLSPSCASVTSPESLDGAHEYSIRESLGADRWTGLRHGAFLGMVNLFHQPSCLVFTQHFPSASAAAQFSIESCGRRILWTNNTAVFLHRVKRRKFRREFFFTSEKRTPRKKTPDITFHRPHQRSRGQKLVLYLKCLHFLSVCCFKYFVCYS